MKFTAFVAIINASLLTAPAAEEQALLGRATSGPRCHSFGGRRFFILLGKSMAEAMLGLMKAGR
jgi:hypothetical protein